MIYFEDLCRLQSSDQLVLDGLLLLFMYERTLEKKHSTLDPNQDHIIYALNYSAICEVLLALSFSHVIHLIYKISFLLN